MRQRLLGIFGSQQFGLVVVILLISLLLTVFGGSHPDRITGHAVNNFLNLDTIIQIFTETSFFAIMAVGAAMVIISGGIDLSVGSIYALCATSMALAIQRFPTWNPLLLGAAVACGLGLFCGLVNGVMVSGLKVHPFIITLGTMWIFRGISFVTTNAASIGVPSTLSSTFKANVGLGNGIYPIPLLVMLFVTLCGWVFLTRTVAGRRIFAVGGNVLASIYSGVRVNRVYVGVYMLSGLTAGTAALVGTSYFGAASCADAQGYELYVIASAVVGGVSLLGGKGSAVGAMLGALLIILFRQAIRTMHYNQNYEWIIIGCAIIVAVVLDSVSNTLSARRLARIKSV